MRRVLLVSEARGFGGAEVYLERLARSLDGWEATLAVPDRAALRGWDDRLQAGGLRVFRWSSAAALAREARAASADLIHLNLPSTYDGGAGWLAAWLRAAAGRPLVSTEHLTRLPRSRRRRWSKLRLAGALRRVIVVSRASRADLLAAGMAADRVVVVANGVPDPGEPAPLPALDCGPVLGMLGSLEPRKRVGLAIRALACPEGHAARLEIAGDGMERPALEELARRLGVAQRVRFLGRVDDPRGFFASIHALALPSRLEGMPLAALEALAAGRGVLASSIPGLDEVVDEGLTGRLLPDIPEAWAEAMGALGSEPGCAGAWSEAARRAYRDRFTLERCAAETAAVYEQALAGERG